METIFYRKGKSKPKLPLVRIQNWSILRLMKKKLKVSNVRSLEVWNQSCKYWFIENEVGVRRGTVTTRFDRNIARSLKETIRVEGEKAKRGVEEFSEDAYRDRLLEIPNNRRFF